VKEQQHYSWVKEQANSDETTMIYRPRSFDQIEGWLLSWGDKVEILEPADLRRRLAETARRIQANHQLIP
jgi:predicted DNA-binding transcriptional regulator YafY